MKKCQCSHVYETQHRLRLRDKYFERKKSKVNYLLCDCRYDVMTTPILLLQCGIGSCCIDALGDTVPIEEPANDPLGVVYNDDAISSSLSENLLKIHSDYLITRT